MVTSAQQPITAIHQPKMKKGGSGNYNVTLYFVLVVAGAALVLWMRTKSANALHTGPLISVVPSNAEDLAIVSNMINQVQAVQAHTLGTGPITTPVSP